MVRKKAKAAPIIFNNTEGIRNANIPTSIKSEIKYKCTTVKVPELSISIKLKQGNTLKHWVIGYALVHPLKQALLYANYNISEKDIIKYKRSKGLK